MRLAGAFRGLTQNVVASASEAVSEKIDRMQQGASQMAQQAGEHVNQMAQDVENTFQETQH